MNCPTITTGFKVQSEDGEDDMLGDDHPIESEYFFLSLPSLSLPSPRSGLLRGHPYLLFTLLELGRADWQKGGGRQWQDRNWSVDTVSDQRQDRERSE